MKRPVLITIGGFAILIGGTAAAWWSYANKTPVVSIPTPKMPSPNAFDDYVAAGSLVAKSPLMDKPGTGTLAEREAVLRRNAAALARFRQGLARPYHHPPARSASEIFPDFARFRELARLLCLEASVHEERGEWDAAIQSRLDCLQFGSALPRGAYLIGALVGYAIEAIGRADANGVVEHLSAAQAKRAAARLQRTVENHVPFADVLQEEKWFIQASLLESFRDPKWRLDIDPSASPGPQMPDLRMLTLSKRRVMANITAAMDDTIADARGPYAPATSRPRPPQDPITDSTMEAIDGARFNTAKACALDSLLLLQLALRAYHLEHNAYPQRLEELVPVYLPRLPEDPFATKGSFAYRPAGARYVLYSVGPDRKDDGGRPATGSVSTSPHIVSPDSRGDIVAGVNR